ncbi:MAG: hypothetical protein ABI472_22195 [Ginsengibacter sp.]
MRSTKIFAIILFVVIISIVSGCYYDKEQFLYPAAPCTSISAKFSIDVFPIIRNKCATVGCHDVISAAGGTILETYAQIYAKASRIRQRCIIDKTMPPGGTLTTSEIAVLSCWISSGSINN